VNQNFPSFELEERNMLSAQFEMTTKRKETCFIFVGLKQEPKLVCLDWMREDR